MTTFRTPKTTDYTLISNRYLRDARLSWAAKGLLTYLLSLPEDWQYRFKSLLALSSNGETSTRTALQELQTHGYLHLEQSRNAKGHFYTTRFTLYELPTPEIPQPDPPTIAQKAAPVEPPTPDSPPTPPPCSENVVIPNTKGPRTNRSTKTFLSLQEKEREKIKKRERKENLCQISLTNPITPEEQAIYDWAQRDPFWVTYVRDLPSLRQYLLRGALRRQYEQAQKPRKNTSLSDLSTVHEAIRIAHETIRRFPHVYRNAAQTIATP